MRMKVLKQSVHELTPSFLSFLKKDLQESEQKILEQAIPYYLQGGRFYDLWHISLSTKFMIALCNYENLDRAVFVPAIILHDSGYSKITETNDALRKGNVSSDERVAHMYFGQEIAEELFLKNSGFGLSNAQQEKIKALIATHDNPYIGKPLVTSDEKIHRDADRFYVLSFSSFVKDFLRHLETNPTLTPEEFMKGRVCMFFSELEISKFKFKEEYMPKAMDLKKYQNKYEPMFTVLGKKNAFLQLQERMKDIEMDLFQKDEKAFRQHCQKRMEEEMNEILWTI